MDSATAAAARSILAGLHAHNHASQLAMNRDIQKKAYGVNTPDIPFPGTQTVSGNTIHHHYYRDDHSQTGPPETPPATTAPASSPASPTSPTPPSPPAAKHFVAVYEEQQPDGSWKEVRREKLL